MYTTIMYGFSKEELILLRSLKTHQAVQDYLDTLSINFEKNGETLMSPRYVMRKKTAHCIEGALFAAAAFLVHGQRPLLLDLRTIKEDEDHVVAPFYSHGRWGAISKTNHAVLRWREPIYKTVRELAASYFHEYYLNDGRKTLREYSRPLDLSAKKFSGWTIAKDELWHIGAALNDAPHYPIAPSQTIKIFRRADQIEIKAGKITEWIKTKNM